jgi:tripartite-type tricarboxylate transporter receptor subunit TctC
MTNPDILPAKNVAELIAYIRERPGKISAGSGGIATSGHLSLELFKVMTGLDILHVPYNSSGLARADLLAGRCQMAIDNLTSYVTDVERGTVRALATGTLQPTRFLPGIPTLSSSGLDGYSSTAWYALAAPAGISPDIVARLNQEVNRALASPAFVERLNRLGVEALGGSPDDAKEFFASEARKWKTVVEAARTVLDQ